MASGSEEPSGEMLNRTYHANGVVAKVEHEQRWQPRQSFPRPCPQAVAAQVQNLQQLPLARLSGQLENQATNIERGSSCSIGEPSCYSQLLHSG